MLERLYEQVQATQHKIFFSTQSHYYDQVLALFGLGFMEHRFRFDAQGNLLPAWALAPAQSRRLRSRCQRMSWYCGRLVLPGPH